MQCSVIIVAGGGGSRFHADKPKQFIELNGKPVLAYALDKFEDCEAVDEIILVTRDIAYCIEFVVNKYDYKKISAIVVGGENRQESVRAGLLRVTANADIVLVHDAARPFVRGEDILAVIRAAAEHSCCALGVRVKDTIKLCAEDNRILQTPERNMLWAAQTPQGFAHELLVRAHESARADGYIGTDDVSLAERLGYESYIVPGHYDNIKITTTEDMAYAEWRLSR